MNNGVLKTAFVKKYRNELFIACGGVLLFFLSLFLPPIADDWGYMTSPRIQEFSLAKYRRLCDVLIGMVLQSHPDWFPHLNRVIIIASHTACALVFLKISVNFLKVTSGVSLFFTLAFLIGGNTITTVFNYDCFNQTGSLMFGALGIYFFLKSKSIIKQCIVYFIFCMLALCVKESGIVYFAIIPLFGTIRNMANDTFDIKSEIKTLGAFYIPGFICALLYYFSPIIQSENLFVYSGGTIWRYLIGICMRIVFAYSHIDIVSMFIFRGSVLMGSASMSAFVIVAATVLLSLPILIISAVVLISYIRNRNMQLLIVLLLVVNSILVFTPTLLATPTGSIWSYNCIVFFANFVFCRLLNTVKRKTIIAITAAFALASTITSTDIYVQVLQTGIRQKKAMEKISASLTKDKIKTYIVYNINSQQGKKGSYYPVALYTMQQIFDLGIALVSVFGYGAQCTSVYLCNEQFEYKGIPGRKPTYFALSDVGLLQYVQQEAQKAVAGGGYDLALILLPTDEWYLYQ